MRGGLLPHITVWLHSLDSLHSVFILSPEYSTADVKRPMTTQPEPGKVYTVPQLVKAFDGWLSEDTLLRGSNGDSGFSKVITSQTNWCIITSKAQIHSQEHSCRGNWAPSLQWGCSSNRCVWCSLLLFVASAQTPSLFFLVHSACTVSTQSTSVVHTNLGHVRSWQFVAFIAVITTAKERGCLTAYVVNKVTCMCGGFSYS